MNWKFEVRNYRSFTDDSPLTINLSEQITALLGPNNSGKTSILKFFWEFGNFLSGITSNFLSPYSNEHSHIVATNLKTISNPNSVFSDFNDRPIVIDMIYEPSDDDAKNMAKIGIPNAKPIKIRAIVSRENLHATFQILHKDKFVNIHSGEFSRQLNGDISYLQPNNGASYYYWSDRYNGIFSHVLYFPMLRAAGHAELHDTFDLFMGSAAISSWNSYKRSNDPTLRRKADKVERELAHIFEYDSLDISTNSEDRDYIVKIDNNHTVVMKDMGGGFSQFFLLLLNLNFHAIRFVLLDEPEIGLHPRLQAEFIRLAAKKVDGPVIFSTHSLGLARSVADEILSIGQKDKRSYCRKFGDSINPLEQLGEMSYSTWRDSGTKGVLFVEGPHELKVFQEWLQKLGMGYQWIILHLGGSTTIDARGAEAISSVSSIYHNVAAIIDSEKKSESDRLEEKRVSFKESCKKAGIQCHVLERRATENYFTVDAIQKVKGPNAVALSPYDSLKGWGKSENFKIAAEMTDIDLITTDVGKFILSLK